MTNKITIGADPEYGLIENGRLVSATGVIRGGLEQPFGVDGCGRVAELRPAYASTPEGLVINIDKALTAGVSAQPELLKFKFKAGSVVVDEPIGGHIHFGHAKLKDPVLATRLSNALDRTLAVMVLMVEDQEEALNRRLGSSYGSVGNGAWRDQPWGMEYRVLPSWLTHPVEARAILSLGFAIASEFDDEDAMEEACSLPGFESQSFRECDKMGLLYHIPPIVKYIRKLPKYAEYESAIRPLFQLIKDRRVWSCDANMLDSWQLREAVEKKVKSEKKKAELV